MFSLVNAAVTVQMCVPTIFEAQACRDAGRFKRICAAALVTTGLINASFGLAGSIAFGARVPGNVLLSLPASTVSAAGRASLLLVAAAGYAMMVYTLLFPIAEAAEASLRRAFTCWWFVVPRSSALACLASPLLAASRLERRSLSDPCLARASGSGGSRRRARSHDHWTTLLKSDAPKHGSSALLRGVLVFVGVAIALCCDQLSSILDFSGSLSTIALMVLAPGVIGLKLKPSFPLYLHVVFGLIMSVACFVFRTNSPDDLACFLYV